MTVQDVVGVVSLMLCVPLHDIMRDCRHQHVVFAREVITYLCRRMTSASFPDIARVIRPLSGAPHSTTIGCLVRINRRIEKRQVVGLAHGVDHKLRTMTVGELVAELERRVRAAVGG